MARVSLRRLGFVLSVAALPGCAGELTAFAALTFSMTIGAWFVGRERQRRALYEAETMRKAIASGDHRGLEEELRRELALAAAGEAVSVERQWLARAKLGGLLVAEWRLAEAAETYGEGDDRLPAALQPLAAYGRHELAVLTGQPNEASLTAIYSDRDACLIHVPEAFRDDVQRAWRALEGLCLVRMGRAREAVRALEDGLPALDYNPARVVYLFHLGQAYERLGERRLAAERYDQAATAFPGTRLASEAQSRRMALGAGGGDGLFRRMLPEAPDEGLVPASTTATDGGEDDDNDE